jgi:hypothetical protein
MARFDLGRLRGHPLGVEALELGIDRLVVCVTRYHDGIVFHAACCTDAPNVLPMIGFCVAAITRASAGDTSLAKTSWNRARSM